MHVAAIKSANLPDMSIRIMLSILTEAGLSAEAALEAADLPDGLPSLPGEIAAYQEFQFQRAFSAITGYRPDLWIKTGAQYHLPSYGQLGLALMTSPSLREFISTGIDGRSLDYSLAEISPIFSQDKLRGQRIGVADVPDPLREFTVYRDVAAVVTALQDVWSGQFPVNRIELSLANPGLGPFEILGYPVAFNCEANAIIWDGAIGESPLLHGNPVLHAAYIENVRMRSRLRESRDDLVEAICAAMMRSGGAVPTLGALAAETGNSERTLQRRLFDKGVRFRDLLDEARRRVSLDLLINSSLPIAQIAWRLGYTETTSFNHAFRRWTGGSPALVRRAGKRPPGRT